MTDSRSIRLSSQSSMVNLYDIFSLWFISNHNKNQQTQRQPQQQPATIEIIKNNNRKQKNTTK